MFCAIDRICIWQTGQLCQLRVTDGLPHVGRRFSWCFRVSVSSLGEEHILMISGCCAASKVSACSRLSSITLISPKAFWSWKELELWLLLFRWAQYCHPPAWHQALSSAPGHPPSSHGPLFRLGRGSTAFLLNAQGIYVLRGTGWNKKQSVLQWQNERKGYRKDRD